MILWHFARCGEFSEGLICVLVSSGNIHMSRPAGIEPTPVRTYATAPASHRRRFDSCRRTYS